MAAGERGRFGCLRETGLTLKGYLKVHFFLNKKLPMLFRMF